VATDGYPSGLLGELEGLIVPTRGQVIATEPLSDRLFDAPHYGRHGFDYWHQTEDGRIVAGGFRDVSLEQEFTADEELTDPVQRALSTFVNDLVGRQLRVDYRWAGIFGLVLDFLPVVGEVPGLPGTWVAGGYSGHGNVLGFACGRLVARAISATAIRCSTSSSPPGCSAEAVYSSSRGRSISTDLSSAARAIARSWIARPVESNSVTSSSLRRPSASPARTAPSCVTSSRPTMPSSTPAASSPPWLACSQSSQKRRARAELRRRDLRLAGAVRAHQRHVLARPQRAGRVEHVPAGGDGDDDIARERLLERACDGTPSSSATSRRRCSSTSHTSGRDRGRRTTALSRRR
jgi:hypothetical protein